MGGAQLSPEGLGSPGGLEMVIEKIPETGTWVTMLLLLFFFFVFLSFCYFFGPLLQHMEVPRLGV